jgi:iron complex transport system ATP-binding protein
VSLHARDLTLGYGGDPVVADLSLELPPGEITAIVGANACGKSTLLRGMARLLAPRSGAVLLDGVELAKLGTREVARRLGLLPQSPAAPEGLTVEDLVARGRYPHQSWLQQFSAEDQAQIEWALEVTDTAALRRRALDQLSGGQRQRAWIAMALAQDTGTLLLDEPTTFLDMAHQVEVLDLLADLNREQGRTIVMVLHDLNQACRYADHLVAMRRGSVHSRGAPADIVDAEMVRAVFGLDVRVVPDPEENTPMCIPARRRRRSPVSEAPLP